jgi:hypothetical protein
VTREYLRVEPDALGMRLDDIGNTLICEPLTNLAALADRPEQRSSGDAGCLLPCPQCPDRAGDRAADDADGRALPLLVGLTTADGDPQPRLALLEILDIEGDEFGAAFITLLGGAAAVFFVSLEIQCTLI